ncbi:MAG: hypothetical protein L0H70_10350, partial [Xanthomonadales bacterium]|nr:hypothetical protein [Xanthomonadales bacterium]
MSATPEFSAAQALPAAIAGAGVSASQREALQHWLAQVDLGLASKLDAGVDAELLARQRAWRVDQLVRYV